MAKDKLYQILKLGILHHGYFWACSCHCQTSQICSIKLRFVEIDAVTLAEIHYYILQTIPAHFEHCDMEHCLAQRLNFQLGRQISCKGVIILQRCSSSLWPSWSVKPQSQVPEMLMRKFLWGYIVTNSLHMTCYTSGSKNLLGRKHSLTLILMWWRMNWDLSDQVILFRWFMVQSHYSHA